MDLVCRAEQLSLCAVERSLHQQTILYTLFINEIKNHLLRQKRLHKRKQRERIGNIHIMEIKKN